MALRVCRHILGIAHSLLSIAYNVNFSKYSEEHDMNIHEGGRAFIYQRQFVDGGDLYARDTYTSTGTPGIYSRLM